MNGKWYAIIRQRCRMIGVQSGASRWKGISFRLLSDIKNTAQKTEISIDILTFYEIPYIFYIEYPCSFYRIIIAVNARFNNVHQNGHGE